MERKDWPTFGQTLDYLANLGFVFEVDPPGRMVCRHPEEGSWFLFRDRDRDTPAREIELLDMRAQLTGRGFVTDEEFAQFWTQYGWRKTQPAQPVT